jgi:hypothetical protein
LGHCLGRAQLRLPPQRAPDGDGHSQRCAAFGDAHKLAPGGKEFYLSTVIQELYEHGKVMEVCQEWAKKQHDYYDEDLGSIADFRKNELEGKTGGCYKTVSAKLDALEEYVKMHDSFVDDHMKELAKKYV